MDLSIYLFLFFFIWKGPGVYTRVTDAMEPTALYPGPGGWLQVSFIPDKSEYLIFIILDLNSFYKLPIISKKMCKISQHD